MKRADTNTSLLPAAVCARRCGMASCRNMCPLLRGRRRKKKLFQTEPTEPGHFKPREGKGSNVFSSMIWILAARLSFPCGQTAARVCGSVLPEPERPVIGPPAGPMRGREIGSSWSVRCAGLSSDWRFCLLKRMKHRRGCAPVTAQLIKMVDRWAEFAQHFKLGVFRTAGGLTFIKLLFLRRGGYVNQTDNNSLHAITLIRGWGTCGG